MTPIVFAIILIRVLSVYIIAQGLILVAHHAIGLLSTIRQWPEATDIYWTLSATFILLPLLAGTVLWLSAAAIARLLVGTAAPADGATPLSVEAVAGAAISVAGLLIVAVNLPSLLSFVLMVYGEPPTSGLTYAETGLAGNALAVVFGVVMVVGVRKLIRLIKRLRGFDPD